MTTELIYMIVFGMLVIGAIILAIIVTRTLRKGESIELIQGKLENSDSSISDAMSYLKITNEWSK